MASGIMLSNHVFCVSGYPRRHVLRAAFAHGGFLLGLRADVAAFGAALGHVHGARPQSAAAENPFPRAQVPAAGPRSRHCRLWAFRVHPARCAHLYAGAPRSSSSWIFSEPPLLFYLDYLAMMGTFICLGHYLSKLLQRAAKGRRIGNECRATAAALQDNKTTTIIREVIHHEKEYWNRIALYPTPLVVVGAMVDGKPKLAAGGHCGYHRPRPCGWSALPAHTIPTRASRRAKNSPSTSWTKRCCPGPTAPAASAAVRRIKSTLFDYVLDDAGRADDPAGPRHDGVQRGRCLQHQGL